MSIQTSEQETTVNFSRDSDLCTVFTSDRTIMTKLDKLVNDEDSPLWKLKEVRYFQNGELASKIYETHKRLISFRSNITTRELTEEQKEAVAERMREYHEQKKLEAREDIEWS